LKIKDVRVTPLMEELTSIAATSPALVEVETDQGIVGIGEACVASSDSSRAVQKIIEVGFKPILLGEDPTNIHRLWQKMYQYCDQWSLGSSGLAAYAISGVDVALWDILGKALHQPVYTLLGGSFRDHVRAYASTVFNMDSPEETAKEGKRYLAEGYTAVKFGWGLNRDSAFGLNARRDEEIVRVIRAELGPDVQIMVDVGRFAEWTLPHAIRMAKRFEKYDIFWLEEPLPSYDLEGYANLTSRVDLYIAAGENEYTRFGFKQLITKRAVDIVQPDLTRAGGLTEARKVADLADMWNIMLVPHSWSTAINVAASLQFVASLPRAYFIEYRKTTSPLMTQLIKRPFCFQNGDLVIPEDPRPWHRN